MDRIVQDRLEDVKRLCENRDVLFLDLIGSAADLSRTRDARPSFGRCLERLY